MALKANVCVWFDWPPLKPEQEDGKSQTGCSEFVHSGFLPFFFSSPFLTLSARGEGVQCLARCAR